MPAPTACCNPCDPETIVEVPGTQGSTGAAGVAAFTTTTANFTIPAAAALVSAPDGFVYCVSTAMLTVGQTIFISDGTEWGTFTVVSIPTSTTITARFLEHTGDSAVGLVINSGADVVPAGTEGAIADPLLIANGGTSSATKAAAQVALGLGQGITQSSNDALAYDIINSYTTIGLTVTVPTPGTGLYLVLAQIAVIYTGTTFAADRTLNIRVRNITQATTVSESTRHTNTPTTEGYPTFDYVLPFKAVTLTQGDVLNVQVYLNTVESAGSSQVASGSLAIIPLALA